MTLSIAPSCTGESCDIEGKVKHAMAYGLDALPLQPPGDSDEPTDRAVRIRQVWNKRI